jgi:Tfp pilus assembly protein PilV
MKRAVLTAGVLGLAAVLATPTAASAAVTHKNIPWVYSTLGGSPSMGKAKFSHKGDKVTVCDTLTDVNATVAVLMWWDKKGNPGRVGEVRDGNNDGKCKTKSFDKKVKEGTKVSIVLWQVRGNKMWNAKFSKYGRA